MFVNTLVTEESEIRRYEKKYRIVLSISPDFCRFITNGEWKLPKHNLFTTAIRHLYRDNQLNIILNPLRHSKSYSFILQLESSTDCVLQDISNFLTSQIIIGEGNLVFHTEWENINKFTTNNLGISIVNSIAGIILQKIKHGVEIDQHVRKLPVLERN